MLRELRSRRKTRSILLSSLVAFTLLTAPTLGAVQVGCDQCPPTCPMHNGVKSKHAKLSCHNQGSMRMQHGQQGKDHRNPQGCAFSQPSCGHNGTVPGLAMGPMILGDGPSIRIQLPAQGFLSSPQLLRIRFNDPPTPRPPIIVS